MKAIAFLLFFLAVYCSIQAQASPVAGNDNNNQGSGSKPEPVPAEDNHSDDIIDMKEMGVEVSPNGTMKYESVEQLIEIYQMGKNINKTKIPSHFGADDGEYDRRKRLVFGIDGRVPVSSTSSFPYCAIGVLDNGCTAVFIGPYHALTSATCVYNTATNTWRGNYNIRRARNCRTYGTQMYATGVRAVVGLTLFHNSDYNFALIITRSTAPTSCYAGFGYINNWPNLGFDLVGYPSDRTRVPGCFYQSMYSSSCSSSSLNPTGLQYRYHCDTVGTYGAPLFSEVPDTLAAYTGQRVVYGVNSNYDSTRRYNYGTRINRDRFNLIVGWMIQSGYNPLA